MDKENDSSSAALVVHSVQDQSVDVDTSLEHSGQTQPESDQMQAGTAVATRGTSALHIRIAPIGNNPIQSSSSTTHEKEKTGADGDEEAVSDNSADEREEAVVERRRLDRERRQQQRNQLRDEAKKQAEEDAWKTAVRGMLCSGDDVLAVTTNQPFVAKTLLSLMVSFKMSEGCAVLST